MLMAGMGARAEPIRYELRGRLLPATRASVRLDGATAPFEDSTLASDDGRFRFRGLLAGAYTLGAFVPGRGEMRRTVELAPQFSDVWNHLGTIAYQSRDYARAETCFRKALEADPAAFQPLVNLGGVSINLSKFEQALQYNLYAALTRPNDALANSQLGMTYFYLDKLELARKYLTTAKRLDPAHFSHPQLVLAEIGLRQIGRGPC